MIEIHSVHLSQLELQEKIEMYFCGYWSAMDQGWECSISCLGFPPSPVPPEGEFYIYIYTHTAS